MIPRNNGPPRVKATSFAVDLATRHEAPMKKAQGNSDDELASLENARHSMHAEDSAGLTSGLDGEGPQDLPVDLALLKSNPCTRYDISSGELKFPGLHCKWEETSEPCPYIHPREPGWDEVVERISNLDTSATTEAANARRDALDTTIKNSRHQKRKATRDDKDLTNEHDIDLDAEGEDDDDDNDDDDEELDVHYGHYAAHAYNPGENSGAGSDTILGYEAEDDYMDESVWREGWRRSKPDGAFDSKYDSELNDKYNGEYDDEYD